MTSEPAPTRAFLFCPGDRPDRYARAVDSADSVILDLEDAVAPEAKERARAAVVRALVEGAVDQTRTVVRVNPTDGPWGAEDVRALRETPARTLMLPKADDPRQLEALGRWSVIALCETAAGVLAAERLAQADNCRGLMWGGEDLTADVGGRASRGSDGSYHDLVRFARTFVLLAAGAQGQLAVDGVFLDIHDAAGLAAEAGEAVAMGFDAKAAIHPRQIDPIRQAFAATEEETQWAQEVVAAVAAGGVTTVRGRMVDAPLLVQARAILGSSNPVGGGDSE